MERQVIDLIIEQKDLMLYTELAKKTKIILMLSGELETTKKRISTLETALAETKEQ